MLPVVVVADGVSLSLWGREDSAAIRGAGRREGWHADFPREDDVDAASLWRDGDPWGPRSIVVEGLVVGSIGFHGQPEIAADGAAEAEVGYGLVEGLRGRGLATAALRALLAEADLQGVRVRACVLPDNAPSIHVLARCGFTDLRGTSEDGELVMVRPLP